MIEKSDITAMGVVVPEVLVTEGDHDGDATAFMNAQGRAFGAAGDNDEDDPADMMKTFKSNSLVEFMQIESQVK